MSIAAGAFPSVPKDHPKKAQIEELEFKIDNDRRAPVNAAVRGGGDDHDDEKKRNMKIESGVEAGANKFSLKEQIEKDDKSGEGHRGWKQLLLGSLHGSAVNGSVKKESEVQILSLAIQCSGRSDLILPIPILSSNYSSKRTLFVLKEGCRCRTKFSFAVLNNAVSGLRYTYAVWKTGVRVGNTKTLVGSFSPRKEPYSYELAEETIPTGIFARGTYFVRTKFVDEDGKCHMEFSYYFEIRKNWQ